ncbi:MAG: Na(+)/H(+) antiporter subunit B [Bacteroidota bacterium]
MKILRNSVLLVVIGFMAWMMYDLYASYNSRDALNETAAYYAGQGPAETGAANLVTSVVVTYRGLDTLGEVTILFLTAAIIGLLLRTEKNEHLSPLRTSSELLVTAARMLIPVITLIGVYIFINGHLTPGGGFQGGAILASTFILLLISASQKKIGHRLLEVTESFSGFTFVMIGILGVILAAGFLDNSILPPGKFGALFSAGAIPLIYSLIGLKVGAELSTIILGLNHIQGHDEETN